MARRRNLSVTKRKRRAGPQVELVFDQKHKNLEDVRGELSTSVLSDRTLFLAHDESSAMERLLETDREFTEHKSFELAEFFDLPDGGEGETDEEGLAWEEPYLWFAGSMSLKRDTPDEDHDDQAGAKKLQPIGVDKNRFSLGCIPCAYDEKKGKWKPKKKVKVDGKNYTAMLLGGGSDSTVLTELLSTNPQC